MSRILPQLPLLGRYFFGWGMTLSGVMQLYRGAFVRLAPRPPGGTLATGLWPRVVGVILVVAGIMIIREKWKRAGAAVIGALLLVVLGLYVPVVATKPGAGFMWTAPCKALALLGGAILLGGFGLSGSTRLQLGRVLVAQFLIVAGIQHFAYAGFVHTMVPAWMPARPFWTYFTAVALLAGGVGLLLPRTARPAGALSGLMIFLWVPLLHIPRALAVPHVPGEADGVCEALALSGLAFLAAGVATSSSSQK